MNENEKCAIFEALHFIFKYLFENASSIGLAEFQQVAEAYSNLVSIIGLP